MSAKAALAVLTVLAPLLLIGLILDLGIHLWIVIPGLCAVPVLLIAIGARPGEVSNWVLGGLWGLLSGSWLGLWWWSKAVDLAQPYTRHAAVVMLLLLVGLGLLPLLLVGLAFARGFERVRPPKGDGWG